MAGTNQESETIFDEPENPEGETGADEKGEEQLEKGEGGEPGESPSTEEDQGKKEAQDYGGLPFKDITALVKGYKDLQSRATKRDQEYATMQGILTQIVPQLPKKEQQEIAEDPEAFVKSFVQNPKEVLNALIKQALTTSLKETVEPLQGEVRGLSGNLELQQFLEKHPELDDGDENLLLDAMDRYPELRTRKDRLEQWLKLIKDDHPEVRERMKGRKTELEKGASDAKKAASLGGRKSSTPASQGDDFDELVTMWQDRQKFFQR
jgi:hypothetical protein